MSQDNVDLAIASLLKISDPTSKEYGQHWSAQKVATAFAPSKQSLKTVMDWLSNEGILPARLSPSHARGHFLIRSTLGEAERIFNVTCSYNSRQTDMIKCTDYTIPKSLSHLVDYITISSLNASRPVRTTNNEKRRAALGTNSRNRMQDKIELSNNASVNCSLYTAPSCLREFYNIPPSTNISVNTSNTFGIYEIAWMTWLPEDLDKFFGLFQPDLVGQRPVVDPIDGGYLQTNYNSTPFNLEADLDFQYALALTSPMPVLDVQVGDEFVSGDVNNMLAAFDKYYCGSLNSSLDPQYPDTKPGGYNHTDCGNVTPPKVLSISYTNPEDSFPAAYLERQCIEFLKLGLMGVTVVVSSGDYGTASGYSPGTCIDRKTGVSNATTGDFSPQWPASCPWITSVGGTQRVTLSASANDSITGTTDMKRNSRLATAETAFSAVLPGVHSTSGGGFSNVFPAPSYQQKAISTYFDQRHEGAHLTSLQKNGFFNATRIGRGFPDVSTLASTYLVYIEGVLETVYGTSASAPVFASIIALINNERLNAGKPTVGFVNPVLYAHPEALNDITTGANLGCGADPAFRATEGWDAVTGLGSPDFARLKNVFMNI
ncbi:aorsin precursor [Trichoderma gamsii]|uniref:Aorsin n=1 Tax=Trichoderma gamsii TaxID=398673 RepID=A0A2P4ZF52_9HYPO|nr:aorsin precursor [Trichoderma gamsii]PON22920.1 aorsin precursor [Trichoderma gamsii]